MFYKLVKSFSLSEINFSTSPARIVVSSLFIISYIAYTAPLKSSLKIPKPKLKSLQKQPTRPQ